MCIAYLLISIQLGRLDSLSLNASSRLLVFLSHHVLLILAILVSAVVVTLAYIIQLLDCFGNALHQL
jgi:hypothetical protein